jgi:hypothetical protein
MRCKGNFWDSTDSLKESLGQNPRDRILGTESSGQNPRDRILGTESLGQNPWDRSAALGSIAMGLLKGSMPPMERDAREKASEGTGNAEDGGKTSVRRASSNGGSQMCAKPATPFFSDKFLSYIMDVGQIINDKVMDVDGTNNGENFEYGIDIKANKDDLE